MSEEDILVLFETLSAETVQRHLPSGDTVYRYTWTAQSRKNDWKADGYRWHIQGTAKPVKKIATLCATKTFFHVRICICHVIMLNDSRKNNIVHQSIISLKPWFHVKIKLF